MATQGFNEAQMAYIENTIGIQTDQLQTNNAQCAFDIAHSKLEQLFSRTRAAVHIGHRGHAERGPGRHAGEGDELAQGRDRGEDRTA